MHRVLILLPVLALAGQLAGCSGVTPSPEVALEGHEGVHGPPWAPTEAPWVAPPVIIADMGPYDLAPYWGGWYGPGVYAGFVGIGGHHGFRRGGFPSRYAGGRFAAGHFAHVGGGHGGHGRH